MEGSSGSLYASVNREIRREEERKVRNNNEEEDEEQKKKKKKKSRGSCIYNNNVILKYISRYVDNCDDICYDITILVDNCCDILKPVNGFICLIDLRAFAVCIYNIFTLQVTTPWIKSTLFAKEKQGRHDGVSSNLVDHHEVLNYGFGYDPATKEHKVICVWEKTSSRITELYWGGEYTGPTLGECCRRYLACDAVCGILTVGENSWRRIDEVPPYYLVRGPVYVNGSIYWTNFDLLNDERHGHCHPKVIVAFDVGSEKFRVIPIPDFILQDCGGKRCIIDLFEVDGCLALLWQMKLKESHIVKLWIFDDDLKNESTTGNSNWIEETITLPFCAGRYKSVYFHPVAGSNKIILEAYHSIGAEHIKFAHLYSYNRKKMTFKKIGISGISPLDLCRSSLLSSFIKSLRSPLKLMEICLGRGCKFMEYY